LRRDYKLLHDFQCGSEVAPTVYYTERVRKPDLRKLELVVLLNELRENKDAIVALGHEFGASHIRVFGSVARYEESAR